MKLTRDDLGDSTGKGGGLTPDKARKTVDENLDPKQAMDSSSTEGIKDIIREVRETVQEFNGLTDTLKENPQIAKAVAQQGGGNSFQGGQQEGEGGEQNMIGSDQAFNLFLNGIGAVKDQMGADTTLEEAEEFLQDNETLVKAQIEESM